jgi:hypothetical protein
MLWGEAVRHAVWLKNRTPTKALDGGTLLEAATGKKPDLCNARPWGSKVWVRIEAGDKLGSQVVEGRWMGVDNGSANGCRVYWPARRLVTVERNIYWSPVVAKSLACEGEEDEHTPGMMLMPSVPPPVPSSSVPSSSIPSSAIMTPTTPPMPPTPLVTPPAPEKHVRRPSQRVLNMIQGKTPIPRGIQLPSTPPDEADDPAIEGENAAALLSAILEDGDDTTELSLALADFTSEAEALEPTSLADARRRPDWPQWEQGIREELATLAAAGTWELANPPPDANIVGSKWVFCTKKDATGNIIRYKARLVAQGYSQVPGIDYFDTGGQSPSTGAEFATMCHVPYCEAVGSLMYASLGTRPDISYAVTTVSCFSSNPGQPHWDAIRRIYRYLLGTTDLKLMYGCAEKTLVGYADADGSMAEDRRAISGYAFLINGTAISWSSKQQEIVSLSTTESEYIAAMHAAKEALWLRSLIAELFTPLVEPITVFSNNQSAIALTQDHQYHTCTKHIDVHFHFIRWIVDKGKIRLIFCPTVDMIADTLTKALPSPKVKHFTVELGLRAA